MITQQAHDAKTTSYRRRCDVMTSYRRCYNVVLRSKYVFQPLIGRNIGGLFKTKQREEQTLCYPDPKGLTDYRALCNLTEANGGMPWFCGKPATLQCEDLYSVYFVEKDGEPDGDSVLNDVERTLLR